MYNINNTFELRCALNLNRIKKAGNEGINKSDLYLLAHLPAPILNEVLNRLIIDGHIQGEVIVNPTTNRIQRRYYAI